MCEPMRHLAHKDVPWSWGIEQDEAFNNIKKAVTSAPVPMYFDSSKPTEGSSVVAKKLGCRLKIKMRRLKEGLKCPLFFTDSSLAKNPAGNRRFFNR